MRKLTRDEELFKSCIKKSKSKILTRGVNSSGQTFFYFSDVDQTGWHPETITDLLRDGFISFGLMVPERYHNARWIG